MSIEWMRRTHAMMPLTAQEREVKDLLLSRKLPFSEHYVFDLKHMGRLSVDFLVFHGAGIVIECTACGSKRGRALSETRRRAAYMDYRFGLLKSAYPNLCCGAVIEAPMEDQDRLRRELGLVLKNASFVVNSSERLSDALPKAPFGGR
jgi:hypothetical protein